MIDMMPIQEKYGVRVAEIPMHFLMPHESQAIANHGQTLQRLAERGGICWSEAWAILCEIGFRNVDHTNQRAAEAAVRKLLNLPRGPEPTNEPSADIKEKQ